MIALALEEESERNKINDLSRNQSSEQNKIFSFFPFSKIVFVTNSE